MKTKIERLTYLLSVSAIFMFSSACSNDENPTQESDVESYTNTDNIDPDSNGSGNLSDAPNDSTNDNTTNGGGTTNTGCTYPEGTIPFANTGDIMPNLKFNRAILRDGTEGQFSLDEFYCSQDYAEYQSVFFVVIADWCTACPMYMDSIEPQIEALEEAGTLVVWIDAQTTSFAPATLDHAGTKVFQHVSPSHRDIIVGLGDVDYAATNPSFLNDFFDAFPTGFMVRKSDMMVVASQARTDYDITQTLTTGEQLLLLIAQNLDPDYWDAQLGTSTATPPPPFEGNCAEGEEEASEPNDSPEQAAALTVGMYTGGICAEPTFDFYTIGEGTWSIDITFSHAVADIDIHAFNDVAYLDSMYRSENPPGHLASGLSVDDNESIQFEGPATVMINAFNPQGNGPGSAPYEMNITEQ